MGGHEVVQGWKEMSLGSGEWPQQGEGMRVWLGWSTAGGQEPAPPSGVPGLLLLGSAGGGGQRLPVPRRVGAEGLESWVAGSCSGESSSAPAVPGPRAHSACSTKGHCEENLKGEGGGRGGPDPEPQGQSPDGPLGADGGACEGQLGGSKVCDKEV